MSISGFKDLTVWKNGLKLVELIYKITKRFPKEERYALVSHMQRAAISIPSNIAEGFARQHRKEFQRFCQIALGSCAELETQLIIAYQQNYLGKKDYAAIGEHLDHESRMLMKLIQSLNDTS